MTTQRGGAGLGDHRMMMGTLRRSMTMHGGVLRSKDGLHQALRRMERIGSVAERAWSCGGRTDDLLALRNMVAVARSIVVAALMEPNRCGTHWVGGVRG